MRCFVFAAALVLAACAQNPAPANRQDVVGLATPAEAEEFVAEMRRFDFISQCIVGVQAKNPTISADLLDGLCGCVLQQMADNLGTRERAAMLAGASGFYTAEDKRIADEALPRTLAAVRRECQPR